MLEWAWSRRKSLLLGLAVAIVGQQTWTRIVEPWRSQRAVKRLAMERRHAMFYEQLPMFQAFWTNTLQCSSEFSVGRIETENMNMAFGRGLIWTYGHQRLIGSFRTDAVFPRGSASPVSATTWLIFDRAAVEEILNDPLAQPVRPFWPYLGNPKGEKSALSRGQPSEPIGAVQTLGYHLNAVVKEMKGIGNRQMSLWGMDAYLSFDQEKNLEIVLTMPLPNPYFSPVFLTNRDKAIEFYGTVTPKVWRILKNSAFVGDVDITEVVSTMGSVSVGRESATYIVLTRSGVPFRASIRRSGNYWELSISGAGSERHREKYNPEFLRILGRNRSGSVDEILSSTFFLLTDKDVEDALKIKPLEHSPPPGGIIGDQSIQDHFR
ncbi:MAG: hypothetical protein ABL949_02325 [Fimbriimonadaceae bacterium]